MQPSSPSRWPAAAIAITVILGLMVALAGAWAVFATSRMADTRTELAGVRSDLSAAQSRISTLERDLANLKDQAPPDSGGFLGGLGEGLGLDDLLRGLFEGQGDGGSLQDWLQRLLRDHGIGPSGLLSP
jgi:hypothetical protein